MIAGVGVETFIGRAMLIASGITTLLFIVLYTRVNWYKSFLGRAVMILSVALLLAISNRIMLIFFVTDENRAYLTWIAIGFRFLIVVATSMLAYVQFKSIRKNRRA